MTSVESAGSAEANYSFSTADDGARDRRRTLAYSALALTLALAIFLADTFSPVGVAVAALYGIVVLISALFLDRRGIILTAMACAALTIISYTLGHAHDPAEAPLLRSLVSLSALTITTFLAVKNQTATLVLAASEQRYRTIFQSTAVSIWEEDYTAVANALDTLGRRGITDIDGYLSENPQFIMACVGLIRTLDVNEAAIRLVDASGKEQLIASMPSVFPPESFPMLKNLLLAVAKRRDFFEAETRIRTFHGEKRSVLLAVKFPPGPQRFDRVLVSIIDITERNKVLRALEQARAELAHISRVTMLGELTASIAHEVNQPLAAVVSNAEAAQRWLDRPMPDLSEARANIEQIIGQGRRAANVVQRLRALSKNSTPQRVPLDINEIVEEAASLVDRELREHSVSLRLDLAAGLNPVSVDRIQLQQVIINLLINAMHAMATVDVREITVASRSPSPGVVDIWVSDSGVGLSREAMARMFTAFYTTKPQGMGMGLSICRSIVGAHGGRIRAERNAGPGATFHISLPTLTEAAA
jgi:signal transduction histidine kinase